MAKSNSFQMGVFYCISSADWKEGETTQRAWTGERPTDIIDVVIRARVEDPGVALTNPTASGAP